MKTIPSTSVPSTKSSTTTKTPSTGALSTTVQSTKEPSTKEPATKEPSTKVPSTKAPTTTNALQSTTPSLTLWKQSELISPSSAATQLSTIPPTKKGTKKALTPNLTSPSRVQKLPPSCLLQDEDSDEDQYGQATSPSDLIVKCQSTDDEGDEVEFTEETEHSHVQTQVTPMVCLPVSIVSDLQFLIQDYKQRFPEPTTAPSMGSNPAQSGPLPSSRPRPSPLEIRQERETVQHIPSSDEEVEEQEDGEVLDDQSDHGDDEDYIAPSPATPEFTTSESQPVDICGFHNLVGRAATRFHMTMESPETDCFLYDFKDPVRKTTRSIPIIDHIWEQGKQLMQTPASVSAVVPRLDKKYKAPTTAPACLTGHPKPDSVVTQAAQKNSRNQSSPLSAPPDKEGRKLDSIGKRFSTTSAMTVKVANSIALLGRYNRQLWEDIAPYLAELPDTMKEEVQSLLKESQTSASKLIDCAMDVAMSGFRQLAGAAVLRRQGWLKATSFRQEVQTKVLDMPYDGQHLFGEKIDEALQTIKKDTDTARALGTLQFRSQSFRGSRGRGQSSYKGILPEQILILLYSRPIAIPTATAATRSPDLVWKVQLQGKKPKETHWRTPMTVSSSQSVHNLIFTDLEEN
ncbi:uncharacterized protein LOC144762414 [Lissotriton helveticus]